MRKARLLILVAFAGLALSACNGASLPVSTQYTEEELADLGGTIDTPWIDYVTPATSVSFPEEEMVINLIKGDTYTYHPTISPKSSTIQALTFTSEDLNVAGIVNGVVTAVGGGSTTIVVSSKENAFDPINLQVNVTVPVTDFIVNKEALDLGYGYTDQLSVTYVPADTTQEGVSFASDDANIVTVNEDGLVTAGNVTGTTKIKVTSPFINTIKEVTVSVEDKVIHVESVTIANKQATLALDKSFALNAKIAPENAENKGIDYVSSDEEVAVVDAAGNVSALKVGKTTITAKSQEIPTILDEFELNVYAITADSIDVPSSELNLIINDTEQLRPVYKNAGEVVTPSRAKLVYESDHPEIATVTKDGLVAAKSEGTAHITISDELANAPAKLETVVTVNVKKDIVTYYISDFADWTPKYGATVFAWAWGGDAGYPGAWYQVELFYDGDPDDAFNVAGTFKAPRNIEGFVLIRCAFGTTTPDWEVVGDEEGRIYNKTSDVAIIGASFVAPEWENYPEEPELEGYGIKFSDGVSVLGKDAGFDAQGRQQYEMKSVHFAEGAKFSIYDFANKAGWVEAIEGYSFGGDSAEAENWKSYLELGENEYTVIAEFTADIFLKIDFENNSIYFGLVEEPVIGNSYAVKIGDATFNMVEKDPTGTENKLFVANDVTVAQNQSVTFYADLVAIKANIGPDADDLTEGAEKYNNFKGSVISMLLIQEDAAKASIYLRVYADGMSFWIDGGSSADHDLDVADEGFGLMFEDGTAVVGKDNGEKVYDEITYHEYVVENYFFASGAQFKLFDFENKAGWIDNIDGWSFNGDSASSEAWKDYLTKGSEYYTIKQDFYADVYLKLNAGGNIIYFGLRNAPIPVVDEYSFKLGDVTHELDEQELSPAEKELGLKGQFTSMIDVLGGQEFSFIAKDTTIRNSIGANPDNIPEPPEVASYNNYIDGDNGIFTIQADKTNAYVELNIYEDGYSFWISGGNSEDHARPENYYLIGGFNSWTTEDDTYKLTKVTADHYQITDVDFDAEDTLKVFWPNGETEVAKYISNTSTWDNCGFTIDGDGNLVVTEDGKYTVDLWFNDESYETGNHVALTKQVVFADVYSMKINDVDVGLVKSVEDLAENEEMKFVKTGVAVVAGQSIKMFADGVAIVDHLGPNADDLTPSEEKYNNYNGSLLAGFEIQASGTVTAEIHVWKDGGVSFWISGGDNADHSIPADYFLIGGFNGWTTEDASYKLSKVTGNKYQITGVEFVAGDTLKVFWPDGETEEDKYFSDASTWDDCGFTLDGDGNVVISADGTYTIDFYVTADYNNHIVPTRTGDLTTLHISANTANVTVGGDAAVITASHVTGTLVAESDDTDIATVAVDGNNITITAVATGTATITVGDDGDVDRTITVNVSGTKNIGVSFGAWKGDSAVIYAWVWGEGVTSQWVEFDPANNRFVVPEGITGLKLVRMSPDGLSLTNKYSFDGLTGTKWNESQDLTYETGKVLTFAEWNVEGYSTFTWDAPAP